MITQGLNEAQKRAVLSNSPKILCLAGAGSGKTRTLTHRVARLVNDRVGPAHILCLTFTRLAGREMKERLNKLIGPADAKKVFCNTFHAFAVQVLKEVAPRVQDVPEDFGIYDQDDRRDVLYSIIKELNAKTTVKKVLNEYPCPWVDYFREGKDNRENYEEALVVGEYLYRLRKYHAIDLDALIPRVNRIFRDNPDILQEYQQKYQYIFVDEFQDTSDDQMELLALLNPPHLFVVGDDYQAIYGWRGAKIDYILSFPQSELGKGAEVIILEENYRSTRQIVNLANTSIAKNLNQYEKTLRAHRDGPEVSILKNTSESTEHYAVIEQVKRLHNTLKIPLEEIAVLGRTNAIIDTLQMVMKHMSLPCVKLARNEIILDKPDVKQILNWMGLLLSQSNEVALKKALQWPVSFYSNLEVQRAEAEALQKDQPLFDLVNRGSFAQVFSRITARIQETPEENEFNPAFVFRILVQELGLKTYYKDRKLYHRLAALKDAYEFIWEWYQRRKFFGEDFSLAAFLRWLKHRDSQEALMAGKTKGVRLMTVHAAKGLEYTAVILVGLSAGIFPHARCDETGEEEERRLFYVATTRAKEHLILSYHGKPGRFAREVSVKQNWLGENKNYEEVEK